ncbi:MAG: VPLPA-CTERM-specific exosortase XrtD [Gammaproteobacteria bacterium]|nr:VPLPA-CTERM-specific exosortase XrtD [Gammaproteobacteria bacterium]
MSVIKNESQLVWRESPLFWALLVLSGLLMVVIYYDGLESMVTTWENQEEYGHGFIIPFITLFLIWQKSDQLEAIEFQPSWFGVGVVAFGLVLFFVGELAAIYTLIQYAFLFALFGVVLTILGRKAFAVILVPMLILLFMIPLPAFVLNNLSSELQLISSQIGVAVIRAMDISVYLEGNVIDLGAYKLQVVEACSGLNYLFPLMTLGFMAAYFFTGAWWKKAVIFLSTIPITVLMNSFRIGAIGVMVEYWGPEMAEGFLHDFEGWVVFMGCIAILMLEMWILAMIGKDKLPLREAFGLDFPAPTPDGAEIRVRKIPLQLYIALALLAGVSVLAATSSERVEIEPTREKVFYEFPRSFDGWTGRKGYLEQIYLDTLKLTDYAIIDYRAPDGGSVNFYSAYYISQKKGASIHSPKSCIPGGGWRIAEHNQHLIEGATIGGVPLRVNRLVIKKGEIQQLVYYWFQQRGRIITNEYMMKWFLFWDALKMNRSDGALIRLTTSLSKGQDISIADRRLEAFSKKIAPLIPEYVPE